MLSIPARIVLLRPRNPQNLGAVARALKNFGLSEWSVVELGTHDFAAARRVAVGAEDLLDRPRVVRTLDEATSDCAWVVGTSSRRVPGKRRLVPADVAREVIDRGPGKTAIVFGDERSGLTNDEVDRCHDLSAIPTDAAQPSVNLAQAVLLYAYELRNAALAAKGPPPSPPPRAASATDADLARIEETLRTVLRAGRFLADPERHAVRDLASTLQRARLTKHEARIWTAALKRLERAVADAALRGVP